ncbi:hypothetical protein Clacol_009786 [Clathrus columnatus]|uniref:Uncharacterized protein n=1 Tax=Clathrus columnatus TaxID=1419009 RepID=A0AAV5AS52_9AGAM|nr:hypothetical protein Clacol_009786 [Clathrus columnatus]
MLCWSAVYLALLVGAVSARPVHFYKYARRAALDTGSCGSPEIEFANGLDGRNQPAFQPVNQQDFNHGSALNIGVISGFICQQLQDKCKAGQATLNICANAEAAAAKVTGGAAADAFNAAFGIETDFADAANDVAVSASNAQQANSGGAASSSSSSSSSGSSSVNSGSCPAVSSSASVSPVVVATSAAATAASPPAATATAAASSASSASASAGSALSFGSCANPAIEFGPGFDGRKATEFSFQPEDQNSISHGSALNINIITQATCDQLKTNCNAPASTLTACAQGQQAASSAPSGGITTDFATTPALSDGSIPDAEEAAQAALPNIGSCTNPTIAFGIFDGRTEDSFEPANLAE